MCIIFILLYFTCDRVYFPVLHHFGVNLLFGRHPFPRHLYFIAFWDKIVCQLGDLSELLLL
jgi:hypothetical protein